MHKFVIASRKKKHQNVIGEWELNYQKLTRQNESKFNFDFDFKGYWSKQQFIEAFKFV